MRLPLTLLYSLAKAPHRKITDSFQIAVYIWQNCHACTKGVAVGPGAACPFGTNTI